MEAFILSMLKINRGRVVGVNKVEVSMHNLVFLIIIMVQKMRGEKVCCGGWCGGKNLG